jgi:hypothetical protein
MQTPEELAIAGWWLKAFLYAAFSALGGVLGHIMRAMDKQEPVIWTRAAIEGIAAGFVGLLMMLLCSALGLSEQWTGIIVGVSGWLGAQASIRMLEELVYKKLGLKPKKAPKQ